MKERKMAIIILILSAILVSKVASLVIDWHFKNERLKIEQAYQEERSKQNQAFLDYLKDLSKLYAEGLK